MVARYLSWQEALAQFGDELIRFTAFRQHLTVTETARHMFINRTAAEAYEGILQQLLALTADSEAAPVAPGAAPDPTKEIRHV